MSISLSSNVSASPEAFTGAVDGDLILFDAENGAYYGSGAVGARIWALMESEIAVSEICATLLREFEVDESVCEREVLSFLGELEQRGLVRIA